MSVLDQRLGSVESSEGSLRVSVNVEEMFISLIVGVRVGVRVGLREKLKLDLPSDQQMNKVCSPSW